MIIIIIIIIFVIIPAVIRCYSIKAYSMFRRQKTFGQYG